MIDFLKIKTYSMQERVHKANVKKEGDPKSKSIIGKISDIQAGVEFKEFLSRIIMASKKKKMIIVMIGGHVIKTGQSLIIIDLMKRGIIKHIAMNGAASIHDFELAYCGETSEDVSANILEGKFGMVEETGFMMNDAINNSKTGMGNCLGKYIIDKKFKNSNQSILANGYKLGIPISVHVAIGTDTIHQHPTCDGAKTGKATYDDFKLFTESVSKLELGVIMNWGSAVIMPEVFLKALTISRNLGYKVLDFTAANFDMIAHYRPITNVLTRPTKDGGKGFSFIGQHELLIPLFYHCFIERLENA